MSQLSPLPRRSRGRPPNSKNRPKGNPASRVEVVVRSSSHSSPTYREYICSWNGCNAKLHNFDTLKKHVARVHLPFNSHVTYCQWSGCAEAGNHFVSAVELQEHVDIVHICSLAWKYGEGPATKGSGETGNNVAHPIVIV
ncbi:predicted protein [Uncinocarpus reesii 1704]|uniref:C2H2-type domain-containing protein n=1 Tax=Uncinocarpus reesii (strain UAMH 1704) TaxID=336963 RepID=C4JQF4_UNCRE|nr:uncharacterized protein UREG_04708 [Uncinocarpus reesii 1704]EEP79862.1 predicted protein [Uncinocarpus reesii 1704]